MRTHSDLRPVSLPAAEAEIERLRAAIRNHRDQHGDDRCWLDDVELYRVLGDAAEVDITLPTKCEFLTSCARYWEQRQRPDEKALIPEGMTIAQLSTEVSRLRSALLAIAAHRPEWYAVRAEAAEVFRDLRRWREFAEALQEMARGAVDGEAMVMATQAEIDS